MPHVDRIRYTQVVIFYIGVMTLLIPGSTVLMNISSTFRTVSEDPTCSSEFRVFLFRFNGITFGDASRTRKNSFVPEYTPFLWAVLPQECRDDKLRNNNGEGTWWLEGGKREKASGWQLCKHEIQ